MVTASGITGESVDPAEAGWVWNSADEALYAAGTSDDDLEASVRSDAPERRLQFADQRAAYLLSRLQTIRSQIELYRVVNGSVPGLEGSDWTALTDEGYLLAPPRNPLAPGAVASRLVVVREPGETGRGVDISEAGWVWNVADERLYAAGFDDAHLRAAMGSPERSARPSPEEQIRNRIARLRLEIANYRANRELAGRATYPTLRELATSGVVLPGVPENPLIGRNGIQATTWSPDQPVRTGEAGWNYDPSVGRLWANSDTMGENEY